MSVFLGCSDKLPEGLYSCEDSKNSADCPNGWFCRAAEIDSDVLRCYSTPGINNGGGDVQQDSGNDNPEKSCCKASMDPGCDDTVLEACVCHHSQPSYAYCCTIAWDAECVLAAKTYCSGCGSNSNIGGGGIGGKLTSDTGGTGSVSDGTGGSGSGGTNGSGGTGSIIGTGGVVGLIDAGLKDGGGTGGIIGTGGNGGSGGILVVIDASSDGS